MTFVAMRMFKCDDCNYEGPEVLFDPDNRDGPITPFYRCPQCIGPNISGPDTDPRHPILVKFELNTELVARNVFPRLSSVH